MYKLFITRRNVITGEIKKYQDKQEYKSYVKAVKAACTMADFIIGDGKYADDNEYTVSVGKVKHG